MSRSAETTDQPLLRDHASRADGASELTPREAGQRAGGDDDGFIDVAAPLAKSTSLNAQAREIAERREVLEFQEVCLEGKEPLEGLRPMKEEWEFTIDGVLNVWVLFNAIVTTMIIIDTFKTTIPTDKRTAFGTKAGFDAVFMTLIAFPLVFFAMLVILVNNNYAERSYYHFLMRGIIIDFPESGQPKFMAKRVRVWLFALCFIAYFVFCITVLIKYAAPFGTIAIILNNLAVGVGLLWFKHQTIEDKFVSLTSFIQSFPDADGEYDNIDTVSLTAAAEFLMSLSLAESREPCYTGLMRATYWDRSGMSTCAKVLRRAGMGAVVAVCCGLCLAYFFFMDMRVELGLFNTRANPCVEACVAFAGNTTHRTCSECIRRCVASFHLTVAHEGCHHYLSVHGCHADRDCP